MAFTAKDFVANMESRLGQGGKHVWDFYGLASGTSWCVGEVSFTFNKIGAKAKWYGGKPVFYVPWAQEWMAKNWECIYDYRHGGSLKNARKGDVVIFMWTRGSRDHIGAVRSDSTSASQILTIEGNTSGSKVARRTRAKVNVFAIYRPPYDGSKAKQSTSKTSQTAKKTSQTTKKASAPKYTNGKTYTVQVDNLNVRKGAGTKYGVKTKKQLTPDGQKHSNKAGQLMKGTRITCQKTKVVGNEVWMKIPSGWVCAYYQGKKYIG